jgi:hypothetical protein
LLPCKMIPLPREMILQGSRIILRRGRTTPRRGGNALAGLKSPDAVSIIGQ